MTLFNVQKNDKNEQVIRFEYKWIQEFYIAYGIIKDYKDQKD